MDFQWILDRLIDIGQSQAGAETRIGSLEGRVDKLELLYDRTLTLETRQAADDRADQDDREQRRLTEQISPARRQANVGTVAVVIAALSLVTSVIVALITIHH